MDISIYYNFPEVAMSSNHSQSQCSQFPGHFTKSVYFPVSCVLLFCILYIFFHCVSVQGTTYSTCLVSVQTSIYIFSISSASAWSGGCNPSITIRKIVCALTVVVHIQTSFAKLWGCSLLPFIPTILLKIINFYNNALYFVTQTKIIRFFLSSLTFSHMPASL